MKNKEKLESISELNPSPLGEPDYEAESGFSYRNRVGNQQNKFRLKIVSGTGTII